MNLIKQRFEVLKKIDMFTLERKRYEESMRDDYVKWSRSSDGELREDTNVYPKESPFTSLTAFIP